ncbi:MAG: carbohydrate-binding domain-containing protein, partial [Erysipelotrichaceae bacterium]|nr:carbohydrate-binding domain-containing protein [Erysipelotrichaceae bacterium]
INDGTISIKAGDGANASVHTDSNQPMGGFGKGNTAAASASTEEVSSKGIDACGSIVINGGTISINSQDDALHSDTNAYVYHGTLTLQAGDDGIHADTLLEISGGTVDIETCYEGLEALTININDGTINIKATDDGINGSNPSSSESMNDDGSMLNIHGGTVTVSADGDGLDMNGSGTMDGGTVTIYGPTNSGNGALDYNGTFIINGGTLAAGGASGMAQVPSTSSSAYTIDIGTSSGAIQIKDSDGNVIGEYTSSKSYQVLSFTSSSLKAGSTYTIYENGTSIGTAAISDAITYVNTSSNGNGMQGGMGGGNRGGQGNQGGNGQQGQGI